MPPPDASNPPPVDPRIEGAVERTLLAWVRTGLATMGLGFVVARFGLFLRETAAAKGGALPRPLGFSPTVGVLLILLGVAALAVAAFRFTTTLRRLRSGLPAPLALWPGLFLTLGLAAVGLALAGYLLVTSR